MIYTIKSIDLVEYYLNDSFYYFFYLVNDKHPELYSTRLIYHHSKATHLVQPGCLSFPCLQENLIQP